MGRHGENIRKRKDGRWEGRYLVYIPEKKKKIYRSVYGKTYREVKKELLARQAKALEQLSTEKENVSAAQVALEWLTEIQQTKKYSTYIKYNEIFQKHIRPQIEQVDLSAINSDFVKENILSRGKETKQLSESMQKSICCVINQFLAYGEEIYKVPIHRISHTSSSTGNRMVKIFSATEQVCLLGYLIKDLDIFKTGIYMCMTTGLRIGEICALKWSDIDFDLKLMSVKRTVQRVPSPGTGSKTMLMVSAPKSIYSKREIPLTDNLLCLLKRFSQSGEFIFGGNKPLEPRTYQYKFKKYLAEAGIENKNFHTLRHTFATNCINNGADVKSLSEILGHSDVQITLNRYVHPTMDIKRKHMEKLSFFYGQHMGQTSWKA